MWDVVNVNYTSIKDSGIKKTVILSDQITEI